MKKNSGWLKLTIAAALAFVMVLSLVSCQTSDNNKPADNGATENPAPATEAPQATAVPATEAPKPTELPTEEPPKEPTKEPDPTAKPIDSGTDYYFDFTERGEDMLIPDSLGAAGVENYEDGILIFPEAHDPYVFMLFDENDRPESSVYKYVAIKLKAAKNDKQGQVRFFTTTEQAGHEYWACTNVSYKTPGEWEIIVVDLSKSNFLTQTTFDGDIVGLRIDSYNDEPDGVAFVLPDDYTLLIESCALFDSMEKAQAYAGLYEWPQDATE